MFDQGLALAFVIYTSVLIAVGGLLVLGTGVGLAVPWLRRHHPVRVVHHRPHVRRHRSFVTH